MHRILRLSENEITCLYFDGEGSTTRSRFHANCEFDEFTPALEMKIALRNLVRLRNREDPGKVLVRITLCSENIFRLAPFFDPCLRYKKFSKSNEKFLKCNFKVSVFFYSKSAITVET